MSYDAIKESALALFAEHGYEGTSLAQIAESVGIKKQSIYSHFKSKDDLFLQLLNETFEIELIRVTNYLQEHFEKPLHDCLFKSLQSYIERYNNDSRMKFFLRISFFPPAHIYAQVMDALYEYIDQVDALYLERFKHAIELKEMNEQAEIATMAFSALIDSICVELVYGGTKRTEKKLQAAWIVFWNGVTASKNNS
ncbi:TetR/AcrR family transcriptional regulator [Alkalihalobacillus sp. 1P02AB]|uniref:TetR/AcrR family transcriptional regulator n=1 Tax=Alkalihalobacillus sp. 1P02AB TaxID=3132260 RepID=UPI0039A52F11